MLCSSSGSEDTQDTSTSTDIENNLILEVVRVSLNCISVGIGSNLILQHLFVNVEVRIAAEVVIVL